MLFVGWQKWKKGEILLLFYWNSLQAQNVNYFTRNRHLWERIILCHFSWIIYDHSLLLKASSISAWRLPQYEVENEWVRPTLQSLRYPWGPIRTLQIPDRCEQPVLLNLGWSLKSSAFSPALLGRLSSCLLPFLTWLTDWFIPKLVAENCSVSQTKPACVVSANWEELADLSVSARL